MLDDLEHVYQPRDDINKMWELWKKQFFKEMKLFTSHNVHTLGKLNIPADRHGSTTTFGAWCVQKTASSKGHVHRDRKCNGKSIAELEMRRRKQSRKPNQFSCTRKLRPWQIQVFHFQNGGEWLKSFLGFLTRRRLVSHH